MADCRIMASMETLKERFEALKLEYEENKNIIAHNIDAFFLIVVAIVIYCKYHHEKNLASQMSPKAENIFI